jgi:hypothetical protein
MGKGRYFSEERRKAKVKLVQNQKRIGEIVTKSHYTQPDGRY